MLITIFVYLFSKLFELIALGVILRTLCEDTRSSSVRRLVGLHVTTLVILGIIAAVVFGMTIYTTVEEVRLGYYYYYVEGGVKYARIYTQLAYQALLFLTALYACAISAFTLIRERTKVHMTIFPTQQHRLMCISRQLLL